MITQNKKLVYKDSGKEVKVGDVVTLFDGSVGVITYFRPPHKEESSGKISVRLDGRPFDSEYYAGVIGAEWIKQEKEFTLPEEDKER